MLTDRPQIEVLLATYDGARFLTEQIDSILHQEYPSFRILCRDDGSSDGTMAILDAYASQYPNQIRVLLAGDPTCQPKLNFLRLIQASTADYLCFADQDDVWLPGKLSRSMSAMQGLQERFGTTVPLLVFTDLRVVDESLHTLHESFWRHAELQPKNIHRLARVLGENVVTGCTAMINGRMRELAKQMPMEAEMHDRWIGLLAATMGAAAAVPETTVLYRQHDRNMVGSPETDTSVSGVALRTFKSENRWRERRKSERQVEALLRVHGDDMGAEHRGILEAYLMSGRSPNRWVRVVMTLRYGFYRSGLLRSAATLVDLWRNGSVGPHFNTGTES